MTPSKPGVTHRRIVYLESWNRYSTNAAHSRWSFWMPKQRASADRRGLDRRLAQRRIAPRRDEEQIRPDSMGGRPPQPKTVATPL